MNDEITPADVDVDEPPAKPGPKPGKAAQRKAEAEATRAQLEQMQKMIDTLTGTFPGLLGGNNVESMTREIFIRSMVQVIGDDDANGFIKFEDPAADPEVRAFFTDTSRAVRNAALIAAHTFYADPATE